MRPAFFVSMCTIGIIAWLSWSGPVGSVVPQPQPEAEPSGIAKRIPWTTSRVVGSPNPPPPYRVRRTFANLKAPLPIHVTHEPGTDRLLLIHQLRPWVGPGRILRLKDDGNGAQTTLLLDLDRT